MDPNAKSHVRKCIRKYVIHTYICHHAYTHIVHILTIYNIIQNGLQPIHHAAQEGHEDMVMILVDDFNVKPDVVSLVRMFMCSDVLYCWYIDYHSIIVDIGIMI